jgi:hypothetical protein
MNEIQPENFSKEEKLQLLGLELHEFNIDTIKEKIEESYIQYPTSRNFFFRLQKSLLKDIKDDTRMERRLTNDKGNKLSEIKEEDFEDEDEESEDEEDKIMEEVKVKTKKQQKKIDDENLLMDKQHFAILRKRAKMRKFTIPGIPPGVLNQNRQDFFIRTINFDSKYRKIPNINSIVCASDITQTTQEQEEELKTNIAKIREPSTDYTIQMNVPISNVVDITLNNVEIPTSWYVFDDDYGTNYFSYKYDAAKWELFDIPSGSYDEAALIDVLNNKARDIGLPLEFIFNVAQNKIYIKNNDDTNKHIKIDFASGMNTPSVCFGGAKGQKLDSSLGWLMGYRRRLLDIGGGESETPSALLDIDGPKYFLLILDDFTNNKPNQDLITMIGAEKDTTFKLPDYWNKETMDDNCSVITFPDPVSVCGSTPVNRDLSSNLTQKQIFTVEQIKLAMRSEEINTYKAPASSDVLARITIPIDKNNKYGQKIFQNINLEYTKRSYFGPVSLSKFRIQLLNDRGYIVNLNNMDWSFSLLVKQQYQYT